MFAKLSLSLPSGGDRKEKEERERERESAQQKWPPTTAIMGREASFSGATRQTVINLN